MVFGPMALNIMGSFPWKRYIAPRWERQCRIPPCWQCAYEKEGCSVGSAMSRLPAPQLGRRDQQARSPDETLNIDSLPRRRFCSNFLIKKRKFEKKR